MLSGGTQRRALPPLTPERRNDDEVTLCAPAPRLFSIIVLIINLLTNVNILISFYWYVKYFFVVTIIYIKYLLECGVAS